MYGMRTGHFPRTITVGYGIRTLLQSVALWTHVPYGPCRQRAHTITGGDVLYNGVLGWGFSRVSWNPEGANVSRSGKHHRRELGSRSLEIFWDGVVAFSPSRVAIAFIPSFSQYRAR